MSERYEPIEPGTVLDDVIRLRDQVDQYAAALKRAEAEYDKARAELLAEMREDGVETDRRSRGNRRFVISARRGAERIATPPADRLPLEYVLTKAVANMDAIKGALKRGDTIPGVTVETGAPTLAIKEVNE